MEFLDQLQLKYFGTTVLAKKGWWSKVKPRNPDPKNKKLWNSLKTKAKKKFGKWSRVASLWLVKEYKKQGGTYS